MNGECNQGSLRIYDTTLRDGAQAEGVSFSKADKVRIAEMLDNFGVSYIEGGWPGSNPRDIAFFEAMKGVKLRHAKLAAFGSTRRPNIKAEDEDNLRKLLDSEAPVVTIFGKTWLLHVHEVLKVSPGQNLEMIADSCAFLRGHGREVVFDAEHFFDGYKDDPDYALAVLKTSVEAGATTVVLCDTNGGRLPSEVANICREVISSIPSEVIVGIHCHNDSELAVANSLVAVESGARHVQGTINGFGERCGNANLCSIIPALELKMGFAPLLQKSLKTIRELSAAVDEIANLKPMRRQPYCGDSAFAHKGGMHVNAVKKVSRSFEHIDPELVGNRRRILVSDLSGKDNIFLKTAEHNLDKLAPEEVSQLLAELKEMEGEGYEFEAADASFNLLARKVLKKSESFFTLDGYRVIVEKRGHDSPCLAEATVKVNVKDVHEITAAEGDGPVNALDKAFRKALTRFYPEIKDVTLKDFKVRILEGDDGTAAKTRVLIESGDGKSNWGTVGVNENIIEASWEALVDSLEYALYKKRDAAAT